MSARPPAAAPVGATAGLLLAALVLGAGVLDAQEPADADPADVGSVDAIVAALYDVISGPAGQERDWRRFRSLFHDDARLVAVGRNGEGETVERAMTPDDYIEASGPFLVENGFFEEEIGRTEERFGPVVHLFSAYASRRSADDPEPFARGINSIQLLHDGDRWRILSVLWTSERPDLPIPERYLRGGPGG